MHVGQKDHHAEMLRRSVGRGQNLFVAQFLRDRWFIGELTKAVMSSHYLCPVFILVGMKFASHARVFPEKNQRKVKRVSDSVRDDWYGKVASSSQINQSQQ